MMRSETTMPDLQPYLMQFRGKDYLTVAGRVLWFRGEDPTPRPDWGIETCYDVLDLERQIAVCTATIRDETGRIRSQGTKVETAKGFADYVEKAQTGAIGRALALVGYGTQFAQELDEGERIVDSPQPATPKPAGNGKRTAPAPAPAPPAAPIACTSPNCGETVPPDLAARAKTAGAPTLCLAHATEWGRMARVTRLLQGMADGSDPTAGEQLEALNTSWGKATLDAIVTKAEAGMHDGERDEVDPFAAAPAA